MKIVLIGPGCMPIPPIGWGAVESLIWDYYIELTKLGHEVHIVNTPDPHNIITQVNSMNPDFVHVQYDDLYDVLHHIKCPRKAATAHYAYLEQPHRHGGYSRIFHGFVNGSFNIFCLSDGIKNQYRLAGVPDHRLYVVGNGARKDQFRYTNFPSKPTRSIYLAKITDRKRQWIYQTIEGLDFAGNRDDHRFNYENSNYIGEWSKETLYQNLTDYANLVLLSDGEADPLVTKEALIAGLGLVISECSVANLDLSLPFITVIPTNRWNDLNYVQSEIQNNRIKSLMYRSQIREYGVNKFSWENIASKYVAKINSLRQ